MAVETMQAGKRSPRVVWIEQQVCRRYSRARILDVGFIGDYQEPFLHFAVQRQNPQAQILGVDINVDGVLQWRLPGTLVGDGEKLPFKQASFDVVLCLEVLEHLYCPIRLLGEFWHVLRPGGELVITTPNAWSWWNFFRHWMMGSFVSRMQRNVYRHYLGDIDHKHFYDPLSLMNFLDDAGFETLILTTKNHPVPLLGGYFEGFNLFDWRFYPMNRLGHYICLIVQKAHTPRVSCK